VQRTDHLGPDLIGRIDLGQFGKQGATLLRIVPA
jgi:hypothetical protein